MTNYYDERFESYDNGASWPWMHEALLVFHPIDGEMMTLEEEMGLEVR